MPTCVIAVNMTTLFNTWHPYNVDENSDGMQSVQWTTVHKCKIKVAISHFLVDERVSNISNKMKHFDYKGWVCFKKHFIQQVFKSALEY